VIAAILAAASTSSCYVTRLAFQQNSLINSRRPVERVLADQTLPDSTRKKLQLTREILAFAGNHGLNAEGAYNYFIQLDGRSVSYIVQAAYPDRLESITSWFPIVGRVPYLGFFTEKERDEKAKEYRQLGYDVSIGGATAYSSLGWFDDPLYSSMLNRPDSELAHLLFHELTHRTLWVAGSAEFNENLAEFFGGILTRSWLESRNERNELDKYEKRRQDRELLHGWVTGLKTDLEALYGSVPKPDATTLAREKMKVFEKWQRHRRPRFVIRDLIGDEVWNNATVLATSLYSPDLQRFEKAYRCAPTDFLQRLKDATKAHASPSEALDSLCKASS